MTFPREPGDFTPVTARRTATRITVVAGTREIVSDVELARRLTLVTPGR
jgi:hypothetical protein